MGRLCNACKCEIQREVLDKNYSVCPKCGEYMRFHAEKRILSLADENSFHEWDTNISWNNPLNDGMYIDKLNAVSQKHNMKEAIITGELDIRGIHTAIGVMDTRFMMASMGYVVGERVTRLFERATKKKIPVLLFCCSGGARMQEGIISLMQMEKTSAAIKRHDEAGLLYISVLTNPTMGGVSASFAFSADIILAEKGAMIGFAGARVIEQNINVKLPERFQTAEFQYTHGFVDQIVVRSHIREYGSILLGLHKQKNKYIRQLDKLKRGENTCFPSSELSAWQAVKCARSSKRPTSKDYIEKIFDCFIEMHGDRVSGEDPAIIGGIASLCGMAITVIGIQKGKKGIKDAIHRNWGMPSPSGYRKALRVMKQAEKFRRPILCFVDTMGAACGIEAEEQGQGYVIAKLLKDISNIRVPVLSIIHGEGGSGGALALSVANEVWMLENAVYSILTPEGYASILWKNSKRAEEASELMKLQSKDLYQMGIVDKVYSEPDIFDVANKNKLYRELRNGIIQFMKEYKNKTEREILTERYKRFRKF